jgi:hypothetical protein
MKNFSDTIGNQSRDLPVCSAVPQPLRLCVPTVSDKTAVICNMYEANSRGSADPTLANVIVNI